MDVLNQMIADMNRKEVKTFKIYLNRASLNEQRKDVLLFDYMRKSSESYNEEFIVNKLYKGEEKNAFYRLKNRLMEDLGINVFGQAYQEDATMHCMFLVSMAHYYASKSKYKLAMYFLKRAEKKAQITENYSLLEIIYGNLIHASREILNHNPEKYIQKRRENRLLLNKMGEMDDILETIEYKVMISQNLTANGTEILNVLQETIDKYTQDETLKESSRLQFGIYFIVSRILLQKKDYTALEEYLISSYNRFNENKLFTKANHAHKLQMLSWLANTLFVNKKYNQSLAYAEQLRVEMERFDKQLYSRFELFYYNSLVINFSVINPAKAIAILLDLTRREKENSAAFHGVGVFVYMNLAVLYYAQKDFTKALQWLNKLYNYEGYNNTDARLKLKISLGELMMRYDREEHDLLDYRIKQVQKEFAGFIEEHVSIWEVAFLEILTQLGGKQRKLKSIRAAATQILAKIKESEEPQNTLFAYDVWLAEKVKINHG
ncbi:MAG: hypothetical protein EOP53_03360 [Sphingobacteriales bacterium]|nr:MAG: hypothetical protein EOP53_03360 [Sphingobacteriales bacterium]